MPRVKATSTSSQNGATPTRWTFRRDFLNDRKDVLTAAGVGSRQDVADILDIHVTTLHRWIRAGVVMPKAEARRIAGLLGGKLDDVWAATGRGMTPGERSTRAQIAAGMRWANADDRSASGRRGQAGLRNRFAQEIDPEGRLTPDELAKRVDSRIRAHLASARLKASRAKATNAA